eukprot:2170372-Pyramimonas_sp.AAC.1
MQDTPGAPLEFPWKCEWVSDAGTVCGHGFQTKRDLMNHMRQIHQVHKLSATLTPTNTCIVCRRAFASQDNAYKHLQRALMS